MMKYVIELDRIIETICAKKLGFSESEIAEACIKYAIKNFEMRVMSRDVIDDAIFKELYKNDEEDDETLQRHISELIINQINSFSNEARLSLLKNNQYPITKSMCTEITIPQTLRFMSVKAFSDALDTFLSVSIEIPKNVVITYYVRALERVKVVKFSTVD